MAENRRLVTTEDYLPETKRYFITTLFSLFDAFGLIRSIGTITHDIIDHIKIEAEREKILAQLQQYRKIKTIGTLAEGQAPDIV